MSKEELILFHAILFRMKEVFEEAGFTNEYFHSYEELNLRPVEIHKSKEEHREAIITLCNGITHIFEETPPGVLSENPRLKKSLLRLV